MGTHLDTQSSPIEAAASYLSRKGQALRDNVPFSANPEVAFRESCTLLSAATLLRGGTFRTGEKAYHYLWGLDAQALTGSERRDYLGNTLYIAARIANGCDHN